MILTHFTCPWLNAGFELFALATTQAKQEQGHFPGFLVKMRFQPGAIGAAGQTTDLEPAKGTLGGRLWRLIIFPPHEESRTAKFHDATSGKRSIEIDLIAP
jgi:hypothetical protein